MSTWGELVLRAGVNTECLKAKKSFAVKEYIVDSTSDLYEKLKATLDMKLNEK